MTDIGLLGIDHVGIAVRDIDDAIDFYHRTFGMRCVHREENEKQGVYEAMMQVGDGPSGPCVQLLAPLRADSVLRKFLDQRGPGMQQLAYTVADIERASTALRAQGLRLVYDQPQPGTAGSQVNFVHPKDAGGVLIELVEPAR